MQKNNKLIYFLIFGAIFLALLIFATFYDLQISLTIADLNIGSYYSTNIVAVILEIFGETVLYIMLSLAFAIVFWAIVHFMKSKIKYLLEGVSAIFVLGSYFLGAFRIFKYFAVYTELNINITILIFLIIISLILSFFTIFLLKKIKKELIFNLFWFAILVISVAIISNLITQLIKGDVFGRMRFRAMSYINDFSYYTPWYVFNGNSLAQSLSFLGLPADAFRSFPSGHTVACAITFCLFFLPKYFPKINTKTGRFVCFVAPIFLTALVGIARIIGGAHFLTDVLFGVFFVLTLTIIFEKIISKRIEKKLSLHK